MAGATSTPSALLPEPRKWNEVKIPFGQTADGKMVSIEAVERGLDCRCFCCVCNAPLVARKGDKNQHHFAHSVEPNHCVEARESSLHKFAKQLICGVFEIRLPDNVDLGELWISKPEPWMDGIRPDVLSQFDAEPVAIEIFVAHRVDDEKIQKLAARQLATFEIDLSDYRYAANNEDRWRELVLRNAPRSWLVHPAVVRAELERAEQIEAERIKQEQLEREAVEAKARVEQEQRQRWIEARREEQQRWAEARREEQQERQRLAAESQQRQEQERKEREAAAHEYEANQRRLNAASEALLLAGLKAISGVNACTRECSVCGKISQHGWGVGFRKNWQTDQWYCLEHTPWGPANVPVPDHNTSH